MVMGAALLLASSAFAANKATLQLSSPASIGGTQLKPGLYDVKWDGTGADVQLSVIKGSKVVATVPAHVIELSAKPSSDSAILKAGANGALAVAEIHVGGKLQALAIGGQMTAASGASQ